VAAVLRQVPFPLPHALRLRCVRSFGRPPAPPFGLPAWSDAPEASLGVLLDLPSSWPSSGFGDVEWIAGQLPETSSLSGGQLVVVLARGAPQTALIHRLLARRPWAPNAVRATALLSRGYVRIGAGFDARSRGDVVWGYAPSVQSP